MYYTYVLLSKRDKNFYIGHTGDLKKRFKEHNEGKSRSTKPRRPFDLIYYEAGLNLVDAIRREKFLKTGPGGRYLKKRLKFYLKEINSPKSNKDKFIKFY
ncbi:MAG: GIY-YIG nuclease family protein [Patescibacteria group bacterium]|nr:GIY-YIG nuclease family protein [Patescibacteria group bacterium]